MEVVLGWINKMRVRKTGMPVVARGLDVFVESRHYVGSPCPGARLRPGGTVIKVVIDNRWWPFFIELKFVQHHKAARSRIHDIVFENVVHHVPLHLEFARAGCGRVVLVKSVVNHNTVFGAPAIGGIAP